MILSYTVVLNEAFEFFQFIDEKLGIVDFHLYSFIGKSTKFIFLGILSLVIYYFIANKEPFSNYELLRKIGIMDKSSVPFYLNEISFYAKYLPSNVIADICNSKCEESDICPNKLPLEGEKKNRAWCRIFGVLDPKDVEYWHEVTYECRKAYFLKYGFLFSAIFLTITSVALFFLHKIIQSIEYDTLLLTGYIILILFAYIFICYTHSLKVNKGGAWRKFKHKSDHFFDLRRFLNLFKEHQCLSISNLKEFKAVTYMIKYIDYILGDKLINHISGKKERTQYNKADLRRILQNITSFFDVLNDKKYKFRAALFLLSGDHKYLYPFILDNSKKTKFHYQIDETEESIHEISSDFFSLSSNSVAAKAYNLGLPISENFKIINMDNEKPSHINSIFCYPLKFSSDVYIYLQKEEKNVFPEKYGVLCIDCDNEDIFSQKNHRLNELLITPFSQRIMFEFSLGLYYSNKENI